MCLVKKNTKKKNPATSKHPQHNQLKSHRQFYDNCEGKDWKI